MTRWEVGLGLLVLLGVAAWVQPEVRDATLRSHRAEVPLVVEALRTEALQHPSRGFDLGPFPRRADRTDATAIPFDPGQVPLHLGERWTHLRGAYTVHGRGPTLTIRGECDVDGDGERAVYVATAGEQAHPLTAPGVF